MRSTSALTLLSLLAAPLAAQATAAAAPPDPRLEGLKRELISEIDGRAKFTQEMVDQIFSFGELGFQEVETSKYLIALLRKEGFRIEEGYAGIPTAFVATWGSGKPVISVGTDIDGIPQRSEERRVGKESGGARATRRV